MKLSKRLSRKWFRLDRLISNIKQDVPIHADGELYSAGAGVLVGRRPVIMRSNNFHDRYLLPRTISAPPQSPSFFLSLEGSPSVSEIPGCKSIGDSSLETCHLYNAFLRFCQKRASGSISCVPRSRICI